MDKDIPENNNGVIVLKPELVIVPEIKINPTPDELGIRVTISIAEAFINRYVDRDPK